MEVLDIAMMEVQKLLQCIKEKLRKNRLHQEPMVRQQLIRPIVHHTQQEVTNTLSTKELQEPTEITEIRPPPPTTALQQPAHMFLQETMQHTMLQNSPEVQLLPEGQQHQQEPMEVMLKIHLQK